MYSARGWLFIAIVATGSLYLAPHGAGAATPDEIRNQIEAHNSQIKALEAEIAKYQQQLNAVGAQKNTLQSAVNALALSQKQLASKIKVTETNISWANKQIRDLTLSIGDKEVAISTDHQAIANALRTIHQTDNLSLVAQVISADNVSDAWKAADEMVQFNRALDANIAELRSARVVLTDNRDKVNAEKAKLVALQNELAVQNKSIEVSKAAQQKLLTETKNQESAYQGLIAQKRAQQAQFEQQLYQYEAQLKAALDPSTIPGARSGVLAYPIANPRVTQYFGKTVDAIRLYVSGTHGGVDFGAPIGTPIKAALTGTVVDTVSGATKSGCQYGKFVLIRHPNGLTTIYGHLSHVYVQPGTAVGTGQVIGLSGDTGYATGPHLHFGVYATSGVKVVDASALGSVNCAGVKTVAASPTAYLNPFSYL
jgi:peptidoglycan DL-endopeptidase CwlO